MALRNSVRSIAESVLCVLPRRTRPGDRLILCYHNVIRDDVPLAGDGSLHLPITMFRRQLELIGRSADIVSLEDTLTSRNTRDRLVSVTFDDAYASALALGVSACADLGFPCTVFVSPALLGSTPIWDRRASAKRWSDKERSQFLWDQKGLDSEGKLPEQSGLGIVDSLPQWLRIASLEDLRRCVTANAGRVQLGNHTWSHANLGALDAAEVDAEIESCQSWLYEHFPESRVPFVAYPYGIEPAHPIATEHGLSSLTTLGSWIGAGIRLPAARVPRWNVPAGVTPRGFEARLHGWQIQRGHRE